MARKEFLDYVWKKCIEPQVSYSFSLNHTLPYSVIAVQEMNLATKFNPLYWSCACLCINAGSTDTDFEETDDDEEDSSKKSGTPDYAKITKAISDAQLRGIKIELPDINRAEEDFIPDIENNAILFSLRTVQVVSNDLYAQIVAGRPYTSLMDFVERTKATQAQVVGLIKAGCFDRLEKQPRKLIMRDYFTYLAKINCPRRTKLTAVQLKKPFAENRNFYQGYEKYIRLFNFKQYIDKEQCNKTLKRYELTDPYVIQYFKAAFESKMSLSKGEYSYLPGNGYIVKMSVMKKYYDKFIEPLMIYSNSIEGLKKFNDWERSGYFNGLCDKFKYNDTIASWEMEQLSFYHSEHELAHVSEAQYGIKDYNSLPENPEQREYMRGDQVSKTVADSCLCCIAGTVVGSDNIKHIINLLTPYGVVIVKMYAEMYNRFKQKISFLEPGKKTKTVVDDSWFVRGTKLLIYGYRRENSFVAKSVKVDKYQRSVCLIEKVKPNGELELRFTRKTTKD